jgi:hypothetical protein
MPVKDLAESSHPSMPAANKGYITLKKADVVADSFVIHADKYMHQPLLPILYYCTQNC